MRARILFIGVLCIFSISAGASPVITTAISPVDGVPFSPFAVLTSDLLQTSVSSIESSGNFSLEGAGGVSVLNNGQFTIFGHVGNNSQLATGTNNATIEYDFNLTLSPQGYNITNITTYGGWNDAGRDQQSIALLYSTVGDPTFHQFDSGFFNNLSAGGTPSAVRMVFADTLANVDSLLFIFPPNQENNYAGYGEIDVSGAPVPEPYSYSLLVIAGCIFFMLKRSRIAGSLRFISR